MANHFIVLYKRDDNMFKLTIKYIYIANSIPPIKVLMLTFLYHWSHTSQESVGTF